MVERSCQLCNKVFEHVNPRAKYCKNDHYSNCKICAKNFKIANLNSIRKTCSKRCWYLEAGKVNRETHATERYQRKVLKTKTCQLRGCNKEYKGISTSKYCKNDHYKKCQVCNKEFKVRLQGPVKTCSKECLSKLISSNSREAHMTPGYKDKLLKTRTCQLLNCNKKYKGYAKQKYCKNDHYKKCQVCNKEFKIIRTGDSRKFCSSKCVGEYNLTRNKNARKDALPRLERISLSFNNRYGRLPTRAELVSEVKTCNTFLRRCINEGLEIEKFFNGRSASQQETRFRDLLYSLNLQENKDYLLNDRKQLNGKELDFYLPSIKLGIEINPSNHHTTYGETRNPGGTNSPKPKLYHYNKTFLAKQQNIELIHLYDWDLNNETKLNDLLSYIKQKLTNNLPPILPLQSKEPTLHWYKPKTNSHMTDKNFNKNTMIKLGYLGIYDDGTNSKPF